MNLSQLAAKIQANPVAVESLIRAGIGVGTALGVMHFNSGETQLIVAEVGVAATVLSMLFSRSKVTPVASVEAAIAKGIEAYRLAEHPESGEAP